MEVRVRRATRRADVVRGWTFAANPTPSKSIEGVWKVTKVVSPDGVVNMHPQPSGVIFSRGYFGIIRDTAGDPRPQAPRPIDPAKPTDAEQLALYQEWAQFGASGGTYEVKGDTLITRADVAKMVGGVGLVEEAIIKFDGDKLTTQPKSDQPIAGRQTTYTRLR